MARDGSGRWTPGTSGNPGGRASTTRELRAVRELARSHANEALETVLNIMNDPNAKDETRLKAVEAILTWAYGDPGTWPADEPQGLSGPEILRLYSRPVEPAEADY